MLNAPIKHAKTFGLKNLLFNKIDCNFASLSKATSKIV